MGAGFALKWKDLLVRLAVWLFRQLIDLLDGGDNEEEEKEAA